MKLQGPRTVEKGYLNQFLPSSLNYLTENKKIEFNGKNLKTDYLINIIHELLLKYYTYRDDAFDTELTFPLSSILLKKKYGVFYNYYMDYLKSINFLILVKNYFNGKHSRVYKIDPKYTAHINWVSINDKIILKKNAKPYLKETFLNFNKSPIPLNIREKVVEDLYDVKLDFDESLKFITDLWDNKEIPYRKYEKNKMAIENINKENIFFKFDEYGRMHTNYTVLKKEIRNNYLTIDNDPIFEIDISNSQPLFLAALMKQKMPITQIFKPEISRYIDLVENKLIYQELIAKCGLLNRKEAKLMMYRVLFGINGNSKKYCQMFNRIFPTVYKFIVDYKKEYKNYRSLSHMLQNLESDFIFNKVINHIMDTDPDIKLFTVHDSIVVPYKYRKISTEIFNHHLGNILH